MPKFKRPEHPDFWLLSQVVIDHDSAMDQNTIKFEDLVGQVIDLNSLAYMAQQRAIRVTSPYATMAEQARYASVYMDAFMAGAKFQARKDREGTQQAPNNPEGTD